MPVAVRKPSSLTHAMSHHARELEPIVGVLALGVLIELLPLGWTIRQSGTGAQSFSLTKDGKEYHFRPGPAPYREIVVKNRYQRGRVVTVIKTRPDALKFIRERVAES